jgi:SAM-dependent methyltransferase
MSEQISKEFYLSADYDQLKQFISYYYQVRLIRQTQVRRLLEIGIGSKTLSDYLSRRNIEVVTCDINPALEPDYVADIRRLPFADGSFELIAAFEILEHLPWSEVPSALSELRRVSSRYVILSLPIFTAYFEMVLRFPLIQKIFRRQYLDFFIRFPFAFFRKCSPGHEWEIGLRGYPLRKIRNELKTQFHIVKEVRPIMQPLHRFFVLEKK